MKHFFFFIFLIIPSVVFAEEKKTSLMEPLSAGSVIQVFAGLVAVLLLFGVIIFVLKRMGGFRSNQGGNMQIVDGVSVSARDRVLLVQVGEKQVLIGVSPGGISSIATFDEPVILPHENTTGNGFSGLLQDQLKSRLKPQQKKSKDQS